MGCEQTAEDDPDTAASTAWVGRRLRQARRQAGLSLEAVAVLSDGEFKASVVGAYERGERNITVARLYRLARVYDTPMAELVPDLGGPVEASRGQPGPDYLLVDLALLDRNDEDLAARLRRYCRAIAAQRHQPWGGLLALRASDRAALAALLNVDYTEVPAAVAALGGTRDRPDTSEKTSEGDPISPRPTSTRRPRSQ